MAIASASAGPSTASTSSAYLQTPREMLLASLEKHNASFTTLLSLIPPEYYIQPTQEEADAKWMKGKKRKTGEEIKEQRRSAKASRLDPENNRTTVDILFPAESSSVSSAKAKNVPPSKGSRPGKSALKQDVTTIATPDPAEPIPGIVRPLPPPADISTLRTKLANKLAAFKAHRKPYPSELAAGADGEAASAGPSSRDALEEESRRRRGEMRDKRRKLRKEQNRAEDKAQGKKGDVGKGKSKEERSVQTAKTQLLVPQPAHVSAENISLPPISLPSSSSKSKSAPQDERSTTFKALPNPTQALANLQKHNRNLEGMDDEKRAAAVESERWAKALHRAEGGKVADDERVLKKAVKRLEKTKGKSGKEWAERKRDLAAGQAAAIKKRNDNIASKLQARKDKRMGIKKKDAPKGAHKGGKKNYKEKGGGGGGDNDKGDRGGKGKGGKGRPGFEGKGKSKGKGK